MLPNVTVRLQRIGGRASGDAAAWEGRRAKRDRIARGLCAWVCAAVVVLSAGPAAARGDWPTCRGNLRRTGSIDDSPGPKAPAVLWVYKSQENYVASPVPGRRSLYVGGLGAFNTGVFHALAIEHIAPERVLWSKAVPYIKRPTVCAPAVADGLIVFGDGMHQTSGAMLYCLWADSGRPVWQLPLPGRLVHLEGAPTIDGGRVYTGGGEAGILCVDLKRMTLDGKDISLAAVRALIDKRWAEMAARYERDRKKDPDFAIPPSDDALPKPAPKLHWQQGKAKWHVDAPVAVAGGRVLAASARIDEDNVGKRSIVCLKAADGSPVWETPLKLNPWAGPTVAGNLVLVGCSSIRFDPGQIKQARGEVVAVNLADGKVKWRRDVPGGLLSPIAVSGGLAVFAATDGKVRAWNAATGRQQWVYEAASPFFAGPAIAGGVVYVADLKAVLHAIGLPDGKRRWAFDVAGAPAVQLPGMVFGSPLVHGGRIYLATCNLTGAAAGRPCVVACVADRSVLARRGPVPIVVDKAKRTVTIPCRIAPRKLPSLKEVYPLEVIATYPAPRGQKAHETVVTIESRPSDVHKALAGLGLKPGRPAKGLTAAAVGPEVTIALELPAGGGRPRVVPIETVLLDSRTGMPMPAMAWRFTGSALRRPDPDKPDTVYGADRSGTLIAIFPVTDETVFQTNLTMAEATLLKLETNKNVLPAEGTAAKLIVAVKPPGSPRPAGGQYEFAPLGPLAAGPQPSGSSTLIPAPLRPWLPPARVRDKPRPISSRGHRPIRQRPAVDLPAPASGSTTSPPPRPLPAAPLAAASARPPRLAALPIATRADPARLGPPGDPTRDLSRRVALLTVPDLRQEPVPFLLLTIPDPFAAARTVQLGATPPDDEPPVAGLDLPKAPTLPVTGKSSKAPAVEPVPRIAAATGKLLDQGYALAWEKDKFLPLEARGGKVVSLADKGGVRLAGGAHLRTTPPATALTKALVKSGDLSVEVWFRPANLSQTGPARIVSISQDPFNRNFTLGQLGSSLVMRLRTTATNANGMNPHLATGAGVLNGKRQHVVFVRKGQKHSFYVDGKLVASGNVPGDLGNWDHSYPLLLGNEATADRTWEGDVYSVTFFNRALTKAEVAKRFAGQ